MKIQRLKKIQTGNRELQQMQQNSDETFQQVGGCPLVRGQWIRGVVANAAPAETVINHRLGRQPEGWTVTDVTSAVAAPLIYRTGWDSKTLTLWASLVCTIDVWVF